MISRFAAITVLVLSWSVWAARAQDGLTAKDEPGKATYFLIDISGSMAGKDAEARVSELLSPIKNIDPKAPVSRTYFRAADGAACWSPIVVGDIVDADLSAKQIFDFEDDFTPMGEALKAALLSAVRRGGPADIYIISDEDPTPGCGIDVCAVAAAYLPLPGVNVSSIQVDAYAPSRRDKIGCIEAAEARPADQSYSVIEKLHTESNPTGTKTDWEKAGWWERWLWLLIFVFGVLSAIFYTVRLVRKAHGFETTSEEIQQRQRMLLAEEGNAEDHKKEIAKLTDFDEPAEKLWLWLGRFAAAIALFATIVLLFVAKHFFWLVELDEHDTFLWIKLDTARKLAWLVLSSNFSNAFAILAITPILFMTAQNWRYMQSKRTFSFVSGAAAEEQARRRNEELDKLFDELKSARESIPTTKISTPWADLPRFQSRRRTWMVLNGDDLQSLVEVKKRLLEFAQGAEPTKIGKNRNKLRSEIDELKLYVPKPWWDAGWSMDSLIDDLVDKGRITAETAEWRLLSQSIKELDLSKIKVSLRKLAQAEPPNE
ncbi:hypothetical protein [uncultured Hyphomonas sp.]|jgi:hypothetical protein|uniref:hypothetical protein n=1 Tax=uncultured Hyphomonas sp. TaxID=225298 RepID=UPI0030D6EA6C|tara:strand:- start:2167 stop:3795 length:1629 start_codon:yes stop_codon:yes gene_type:complete